MKEAQHRLDLSVPLSVIYDNRYVEYYCNNAMTPFASHTTYMQVVYNTNTDPVVKITTTAMHSNFAVHFSALFLTH